jgi:predicted RNA-binding protein YlqC (UPF0109 family)
MARPLIGDAVKDKVISTRVTEAEKKRLIAKYGSTANALRIFVEDALKDED